MILRNTLATIFSITQGYAACCHEIREVSGPSSHLAYTEVSEFSLSLHMSTRKKRRGYFDPCVVFLIFFWILAYLQQFYLLKCHDGRLFKRHKVMPPPDVITFYEAITYHCKPCSSSSLPDKPWNWFSFSLYAHVSLFIIPEQSVMQLLFLAVVLGYLSCSMFLHLTQSAAF